MTFKKGKERKISIPPPPSSLYFAGSQLLFITQSWTKKCNEKSLQLDGQKIICYFDKEKKRVCKNIGGNQKNII